MLLLPTRFISLVLRGLKSQTTNITRAISQNNENHIIRKLYLNLSTRALNKLFKEQNNELNNKTQQRQNKGVYFQYTLHGTTRVNTRVLRLNLNLIGHLVSNLHRTIWVRHNNTRTLVRTNRALPRRRSTQHGTTNVLHRTILLNLNLLLRLPLYTLNMRTNVNRSLTNLRLNLPRRVKYKNDQNNNDIRHAHNNRLLLRLIRLLLRVITFRLPSINIFLKFPLNELRKNHLFLSNLRLLIHLTTLNLNHIYALNHNDRLNLRNVRTTINNTPLTTRLIRLKLRLLRLTIMLRLILLNLINRYIRMDRRIVFVGTRRTKAGALFLGIR